MHSYIRSQKLYCKNLCTALYLIFGLAVVIFVELSEVLLRKERSPTSILSVHDTTPDADEAERLKKKKNMKMMKT